MTTKRITAVSGLISGILLLVASAGCNPATTDQPESTDNTNDNSATANDNDNSNTTGKTYYVYTQGSDEADGLTSATAVRTIAHAVTLATAGDTVAILPGTYSEALLFEGIGSAAGTLTIRGEGGVPLLDGGRTLDVGLWCDICTNIAFEDIEIANYTDVGLMGTASNGLTVRNVSIHGNGFAAQIEWVEGYGLHIEESQNVTIENCEAYQNGPNPQVLERWLGTGLDLFDLTDAVVRNNNTHDNSGGGMLVEDCTNVLVEGNTVSGNNLDATIEGWWDGAIWLDGGRDVTLRNNTITANIGPGVIVSDEDNQQPSGYVMEGNTITGNTWGVYVWNFGTSELPPDDILRLIDNDVSGNTTDDFWIIDWHCPPEDPCDSGR